MISLLALLWTPAAHALSCDEIMNMVNVNVPETIVIQTIEDSGGTFSSDDVRCLTNEGAPSAVIAAAKKMSARAAAPAGTEDEEDESEEKEDTRSSYDKTEALGSKSSSKSSASSSKRELEDEGGGDDEDDGRDPAKLDDAIKAYKAKKPLTSSLMLSELLKDGTYPDKESKILYYLAQSLMDLGMYHSSQYYYIEVLKKGPSNPYFKYALPKLVTIAKATGDESDLARIVAKIPPEEYPRQARNQLFYLYGVRLYEQEKLSEAKKYFAQVSDKSDLYTRSKYFEGVIYNKQGKLKSAVRAFTEVAKTQGEAQTQQELKELDRLRDLALLNIARIYYSIERYDDAKTYYDYVPRDSAYWPESIFESAWTNFMMSDLNLTLGQVLTVSSPFYAQDEFIPEATILRALTFFNLCEYSEVDSILTDFDARYRPMQAEMKDVLKRYSSEEGRKLADEAFDRYFGRDAKDTALPRSLFERMLRNQEFGGLVTHLNMMDAEVKQIEAQKSQWKNSIGEELVKLIAADRERLKRRAGLVMLQEMATASNHVGDLLGQAEIIKFEVVDAQRADYTYKMQNTDLNDTSSRYEIDFATSSDRTYWPFNGEFWKDELGYYFYTEQGSCK